MQEFYLRKRVEAQYIFFTLVLNVNNARRIVGRGTVPAGKPLRGGH